MAKAAKKYAYRFKDMREQASITLEELSDSVGISVSQLSRFESGDREPRVSELLRIAARLRVPWQEAAYPFDRTCDATLTDCARV